MQRPTKLILEITSIVILAILFASASGLFFYQKAYAGKIYKNVYVDDLSLGGMTKKQAAAAIEKKFQNFSNQEITIKTEGKEIKSFIKDTGLTIDTNAVVQAAYNIGRDQSFVAQLYTSSKTVFQQDSLPLEPKIDNAKYDDFKKVAIDQLNFEPKDAQLAIENGQIKQTEGANGQVVDTTKLPDEIVNLAKSDKKEIELTVKPVEPAIAAADFSDAKTQAESILAKSVALTYADRNYTPSRTELGRWITFNNANNKITAGINDDTVRAYLNNIAKDFEVAKKDRKINASNNSVIDEGRQGVYLDKSTALSQIKAQIASSNSVKVALTTYTQDPAEVKVFPDEGLVPGRFDGKYLDVDLTNQKLCRVESNSVVDCFPISSGKASMPTPTGTFHITSKDPREYSNKYGMWMPWWEQFNGDYGIHELPETDTWKEVPDHLGTPVSHGCVRLGVGPAKTVYDWTDIGTPVYIHK